MLNETLLAALGEILPPSALLTAQEDTRPYECDGLTLFRAQPLAVLLPENEAQVVEILKICNAARLPVVARGAGTGLSGGATPNTDGVVLSLAKFKRILAIDPLARIAVLQPGVRNLAISEAVAIHGLYYAPDPSSSGGVHCLKYGLTLHNVLEVRGFLVDGTPVQFGSEALDAPGLDLLSIVIGSEGMLAVITEVTVRLIPKPQLARCIMASFDDIESAGAAVASVIAQGIIPAGLEMMDRLTISAVEPFVHAGYPLDAEAILLCEADGTPEEVEAEIDEMRVLLEESGATRVEVSQNEAQRLRLWSGRKAAFPAAGRISPDYYCIDGTIPRRSIAPVLTRIAELGREFGLRCMNVFHAGDGNLHPLILFDANRPGDAEKTEAYGSKILELCIEVGGTITGEHGVGLEKISGMCVQFASRELEWFHAIKHAFDESGLLNPGKAVPTLYRCAEMGRMHVHRGQLPHPDLPRF
ncbi:MAG: FAD-binding protein [Betaproteobacteria bacterium]|nr:MAG: FAD-binding protein [Betaproteobacteria bacterium]